MNHANEQLIFSCIEEIKAAKLNEFSYLKQGKKMLISLKFNDFLDYSADNIKIRNVLNFPLCDIYLIESVSIFSMYIIVINGFNVRMFNKYLTIKRPSTSSLKSFSNVKMLLQDKYLNVIHSDDGACLISMNALKWILKPDLIRKNEKRDNDAP